MPTSPRTAAAPTPAMSKRRAVLVLGVLEAFGPLSMDLYMPALPHLAQSLRTTETLAQASMSVCMIGLGVGQLVAGPVSDRFGRRRPLLAGVALFTLLSLACAFAPTIELLLLARLLQGLAGSAGVVIALAVARDMYSGVELSRMLALLALVGASAPVLAPVAGGQLARLMDWRGIFGILGLIGGLIFVLAAFSLRETRPRSARSTEGIGRTVRRFGPLLGDRLFVLLLATSAAGGIGFFTYLSMSSFVLQNQFGLNPQLFSFVFAVNSLSNMAGAQISRSCVARLGPFRMYLHGHGFTLTAAAGLFVSAWLAAPPLVVLILLAAYLMAAGIVTPNTTTLALDRHGDRAGTAAALFGTASFVVGPVVAPLAALHGATAAAMGAMIAGAAGLAALLAFTAVRPQVRRRPGPDLQAADAVQRK